MITKREYLKGLDMNNNKIMASLSAVTAEFEGTFAEDFTGAGLSTAGLSGLVPAPQAGDNDKFLCGDGSWVVPSFVLSTVPATVDGGLWLDVSTTPPVPKFFYDGVAYAFGGSSSSSVIVDPEPSGDLIAYLPFNSSLADTCGNEWTAIGSPTIQADANAFGGNSLYLNGSSYLTNGTVSDSIGASSWTIDFWATCTGTTSFNYIFSTYNVLYSGNENTWVSVYWGNSGNPVLAFRGNDHPTGLSLSLDTRHHYALTYDGTDARFFVDGILKVTVTLSIQLGGNFWIGSGFGAASFNGNLDHFRIFNGQCLWTQDFTPPTSEDYL